MTLEKEKQMFVNLTPHAIHLHHNGFILTVPASGRVARCSAVTTPCGDHDGFPLVRRSFGAVSVDDQPFPDPVPGTIFIVSALCAAALAGRDDVASPGDLVRDDQGQIVGCRDLTLAPA